MSFLQDFINHLDMDQLLSLLLRVVAALICIIIHECAHGFAADRLGDHTARANGRLSWNPMRHIDPFGLVMMITAGVGWAKPVPVDASNFKNPRKGMAVTAIAGPVSNFLLAFVALGLSSLLYRALVYAYLTDILWNVLYYLFLLLVRVAMLSVGLGLFNLIPIPPLDGSKVLFSFLSDRIYFKILEYERYVMWALFLLVFMGVLDVPLNFCITHVLAFLCHLTGFPAAVLGL